MYIAELRKRASEADAKLKRLYDAIENGVADLTDPMLKDQIAELKVIRDQARADAKGPRMRSSGSGRASQRKRSKRSPARLASGCGARAAATAATTSAHSRNASKWTRKRFASWDRKAYCCTRSSPRHARKRRVLACPVLYRSGAPDKIRTCDLCLRRAMQASFGVCRRLCMFPN